MHFFLSVHNTHNNTRRLIDIVSKAWHEIERNLWRASIESFEGYLWRGNGVGSRWNFFVFNLYGF